MTHDSKDPVEFYTLNPHLAFALRTHLNLSPYLGHKLVYTLPREETLNFLDRLKPRLDITTYGVWDPRAGTHLRLRVPDNATGKVVTLTTPEEIKRYETKIFKEFF
mgnify:CR=1 FL=1